jgi:hypothetical protein
MNDYAILEKVNRLSRSDDDYLYDFLLEQVNHKSRNIDFWLGLAVAVSSSPLGDDDTGIIFCCKGLAIDNNNPKALIMLSFLYQYFLGGIDDMLLHQIRTLTTSSNEVNSMLKYVASWSYSGDKKNYPEMEEQLLKESIDLCDKYVWNYMNLARLYRKQERYCEINPLVRKAINNVQKIYSIPCNDDITDIDEHINELIKGIHLTDGIADSLKEKIVPIHKLIWCTITKNILKVYQFVKEKFINP